MFFFTVDPQTHTTSGHHPYMANNEKKSVGILSTSTTMTDSPPDRLTELLTLTVTTQPSPDHYSSPRATYALILGSVSMY